VRASIASKRADSTFIEDESKMSAGLRVWSNSKVDSDAAAEVESTSAWSG
jgi:hypothetical protein